MATTTSGGAFSKSTKSLFSNGKSSWLRWRRPRKRVRRVESRIHFMKSRRQIIQALAAVSLGALSPFRGLADVRGKDIGIKFGAQTNAWAIDPQKPDSFFEVLHQVKQIGYDGFETGFFNLRGSFNASAETAQRIAATGLNFFGIHIFLPPDKWDVTTRLPPNVLYEQVAHGGAALGAQRLILSGAAAANSEQLKAKVAGAQPGRPSCAGRGFEACLPQSLVGISIEARRDGGAVYTNRSRPRILPA